MAPLTPRSATAAKRNAPSPAAPLPLPVACRPGRRPDHRHPAAEASAITWDDLLGQR